MHCYEDEGYRDDEDERCRGRYRRCCWQTSAVTSKKKKRRKTAKTNCWALLGCTGKSRTEIYVSPQPPPPLPPWPAAMA
ncbi:uncharacterized protein LOC134190210 isoform X2 [Corticium candelabrum]|uniref:uncharacterized protein LOC134190210 isoform X2 n=1 Tax=Corticium candelabrum TaxID=121492 RepID=UPI002E256D9E|nr:uncharacterized protein LOC134190210 isoform X2 [Corticium candelabrum]